MFTLTITAIVMYSIYKWLLNSVKALTTDYVPEDTQWLTMSIEMTDDQIEEIAEIFWRSGARVESIEYIDDEYNNLKHNNMEEKEQPQYKYMYECKYKQLFQKDSNCIVNNDPEFHQPVTFSVGSGKSMPHHSQKIKEAIENVDRDGLITDDTLWWAIYRVLVDLCQYPAMKTDFCKVIDELGLTVSHQCEYNNWRNISLRVLMGHVSTWPALSKTLSGAEKKQCEVGVKLMEYLAYT